FSGNAQQRKRSYMLHHGTLLHDFDVRHVARYLRVPLRQPAYRGGRTHQDFLTNLPATSQELQAALRWVWAAATARSTCPEGLVRRLARERYMQAAWIRRR